MTPHSTTPGRFGKDAVGARGGRLGRGPAGLPAQVPTRASKSDATARPGADLTRDRRLELHAELSTQAGSR